MPLRSFTVRKALVTGALVVGATAGAAGIASAATSGSTSSTSSGSSSGSSSSSAPSGTYGSPPRAGSGAPGDPAAMTHGPGETLLTGTNQQKADAAATAAEPGATIVRAETDSSGAGTYEVHMKKADGSYVTVYLDSNFKVTSTASGFGGGPAGSSGPNGGQTRANGSAPSPSSSSTSA
jgi:hypothetical protein